MISSNSSRTFHTGVVKAQMCDVRVRWSGRVGCACVVGHATSIIACMFRSGDVSSHLTSLHLPAYVNDFAARVVGNGGWQDRERSVRAHQPRRRRRATWPRPAKYTASMNGMQSCGLSLSSGCGSPPAGGGGAGPGVRRAPWRARA